MTTPSFAGKTALITSYLERRPTTELWYRLEETDTDPASFFHYLSLSARAARPLGGKWMLVYQAAEQLRLWSGADAPIETMAQAFDAAGRQPS